MGDSARSKKAGKGTESRNSSVEEEFEEGSCSDSEFEAPDYENRRESSIRELILLEKQFGDLKELLYQERIQQTERRLGELNEGIALDYQRRLDALEEECKNQCDILKKLREYQRNELEIRFDAEESIMLQNFENDKQLLFDEIAGDIDGKITKLKADKHAADVSLALWMKEHMSEPNLKKSPGSAKSTRDSQKKHRKIATASGPHVIYMLSEDDIESDWNLIKRAKIEAEIAEEHMLHSPIAQESY